MGLHCLVQVNLFRLSWPWVQGKPKMLPLLSCQATPGEAPRLENPSRPSAHLLFHQRWEWSRCWVPQAQRRSRPCWTWLKHPAQVVFAVGLSSDPQQKYNFPQHCHGAIGGGTALAKSRAKLHFFRNVANLEVILVTFPAASWANQLFDKGDQCPLGGSHILKFKKSNTQTIQSTL